MKYPLYVALKRRSSTALQTVTTFSDSLRLQENSTSKASDKSVRPIQSQLYVAQPQSVGDY
jgi:hypothetical protein